MLDVFSRSEPSKVQVLVKLGLLVFWSYGVTKAHRNINFVGPDVAEREVVLDVQLPGLAALQILLGGPLEVLIAEHQLIRVETTCIIEKRWSEKGKINTSLMSSELKCNA